MSTYPYQKSFSKFLQSKNKASTTIIQYDQTLSDFFNYEQHFNPSYQLNADIDQLTVADVQKYLGMLQNQRLFAQTTLNKALSNLNRYFQFLFTHHKIHGLPTIGLQGQSLATSEVSQNSDWPIQLHALLLNQDLSYYTRLTLLSIGHGYSIQTILAPDFYQKLAIEKFDHVGAQFIQSFKLWIQPLQEKLNTQDIFLKQRNRGSDFHLTLPGLHKYLKKDTPIAGIPLNPQELRQKFILWYLTEHSELNTAQLTAQLHLSPAGVLYYQSILLKGLKEQ